MLPGGSLEPSATRWSSRFDGTWRGGHPLTGSSAVLIRVQPLPPRLRSLPPYDEADVNHDRDRPHPRPLPPGLARAALAQLDSLYRLARRLCDSDAAAEDLVQETFARALDARARFVPGTNVRAWLFRILRNLHVDAWRRAHSAPLRDGNLVDDLEVEPGVVRELLRGDEELERLRGVVADDIEAALRALSAEARTIVLLDMEGLTHEELAEVLGCTVGTVKSRLSRARARLRERLADYGR